MPTTYDDDDDADLEGHEEPDAHDVDDADDDVDTIECPHCGASIYEQAEQCPRCGDYVSREEGRTRRSRWVIAGVIVCLLLVLFTFVLTRTTSFP